MHHTDRDLFNKQVKSQRKQISQEKRMDETEKVKNYDYRVKNDTFLEHLLS